MRARLASVRTRRTGAVIARDWDILYLNVLGYNRDMTSMPKVFNPMMVRMLNSTSLDILGIDMPNLPSLILDMGQWDETFSLKCIIETSSGDYHELAREISRIRRWIRYAQGDVFKMMFLQLFPDENPTTYDREALDPGRVPLGMIPGFGYRGMVTSGPSESYESGSHAMEFSLKFKVGMVIPF